MLNSTYDSPRPIPVANPGAVLQDLPPGVTPAGYAAIVDHAVVTALARLTYACHGASFSAGWYHDPKTGELREVNIGEKLMLVVSEIGEAMEADRKSLMDDHLKHRPGVEVELADAVIRIFDLAGTLGLDLGGAIRDKMAYNAQRADHKRENRAAGGKKY